jgi:hypothetical protein
MTNLTVNLVAKGGNNTIPSNFISSACEIYLDRAAFIYLPTRNRLGQIKQTVSPRYFDVSRLLLRRSDTISIRYIQTPIIV